jgi:hypothetical protein
VDFTNAYAHMANFRSRPASQANSHPDVAVTKRSHRMETKFCRPKPKLPTLAKGNRLAGSAFAALGGAAIQRAARPRAKKPLSAGMFAKERHQRPLAAAEVEEVSDADPIDPADSPSQSESLHLEGVNCFPALPNSCTFIHTFTTASHRREISIAVNAFFSNRQPSGQGPSLTQSLSLELVEELGCSRSVICADVIDNTSPKMGHFPILCHPLQQCC